MHRSSLYHGDLVETLHSLGLAGDRDEAAVRMVARVCGFDYLPPAPVENELPSALPDTDEAGEEEVAPTSVEQTGASLLPRERLSFWAVTRVEHFTREQRDERQRVPAYITEAPPNKNDDWMYPDAPKRGRPLLPWSRLWPFLRRVLGRRRPGSLPDIPRVIRSMAEGRVIRHLPRHQRHVWNADAFVLVDRRSSLAPFWDDYDDLIRRLGRMRGYAGLRVIHLRRGGGGLLDARTHRTFTGAAPPSSAAVLLLGDLGQYPATFYETAPWLSLGRRFRARGIQPWALCPCPVDRWSPEMARVWSLAAWDRHHRLPLHDSGCRAAPSAETDVAERQDARVRQLNRLLRLTSPAVRVERGLLRDLRLHLPSSLADAGTEYDAFQSSDVDGSEAGFTLETGRLKELRAEFADTRVVGLELFRQVVVTLWEHHQYCRKVFGPEELEGLLEHLTEPHREILRLTGVLTEESLEAIKSHWRRLAAGVVRGEFAGFSTAMAAYAFNGLDKLGAADGANVGKQIIWALNHPGPDRDLPAFVQPENIDWLGQTHGREQEIKHPVVLHEGVLQIGADPGRRRLFFFKSIWSARQSATISLHQGDELRRIQRPWGASASLPVRALRKHSRIVIESERTRLELGKMQRPSWASRMWYEREGLRATASLAGQDFLFAWTLGGEDKWPVLSGGPMEEAGRWKLLQPPPSWASSLWADEYGLAAEFHIRSVPFVLRWIPPGSFLMGSPEDEPGRFSNEGPRHEVRFTRGFWLGETPITQGQWMAVTLEAAQNPGKLIAEQIRRRGITGSTFANELGVSRMSLSLALTEQRSLDPKGTDKLMKLYSIISNSSPSYFRGSGDLPVESVSWTDSVSFCNLLNALVPEGPGFRLPTEVEWECGCRAGDTTTIHDADIRSYDDYSLIGGMVSRTAKSGLSSRLQDFNQTHPSTQESNTRAGPGTHRVKLTAPNRSGLHDMLGNVWEWCRDKWDSEAYAKRKDLMHDPGGNVPDGVVRSARGGSWRNEPVSCRIAFRIGFKSSDRRNYVGLRLSADQEPGSNEAESLQE
ncbi:MAG: formylglycine-generating enzyme family protein [Verrucomicrobiaceae bacterium]|nr:formylglycine-generating enzyme family protein [Verrucomicrobiaceae bacterium]